MQKQPSIAAVIAIVIAIALLGYFATGPIAKSVNLGLDLRGGLRVVLKPRKQKVKQ